MSRSNPRQVCFITGQQAKVTWNTSLDEFVVESPICGTYHVSGSLGSNEGPWKEQSDDLYVLAAVARRRSDAGESLRLSYGDIEDILESTAVPTDPLEKIDEIIQYLYRNTDHPGAILKLDWVEDYPIAFARNSEEFSWLTNKALELEYVEGQRSKDGARLALSLKGWQRIDALRKSRLDSDQAFVAMWFDDELEDAWKQGIKPALDVTGWSALRIDNKEHNEKIDDHIVAEIRRSGLLIADVTGHRQGVYYEAGLAHGLDIPVIWTCRADRTTDDGKDDKTGISSAHFDTRQYNHVVWTTPEDLRDQLEKRIIATGHSRKNDVR